MQINRSCFQVDHAVVAEISREILKAEKELSDENYDRLARIAFRTLYGSGLSVREFILSNQYDSKTPASEIARDYVWAALDNN